MSDNPRPEYFQRLVAAYDASEAVDRFDLRSGDLASIKEWQRLCDESADAQHDLIEYCELNGRKLRSLLAC